MVKIVQFVLFGLLPYLAIALATPELSDNDEAPGIHESTDTDIAIDADDEPGPDEAA